MWMGWGLMMSMGRSRVGVEVGFPFLKCSFTKEKKK